MILWRSGGKGSVTQVMNDEAVYRTAPATPGLLIIVSLKIYIYIFLSVVGIIAWCDPEYFCKTKWLKIQYSKKKEKKKKTFFYDLHIKSCENADKNNTLHERVRPL